MDRDRPVRVGLLWHSVSSASLGVGALTAAHIAIFETTARKIGCRLTFSVIGWADAGRSYIEGDNVHLVPVRFRDLVTMRGVAHAALTRCDLVCDLGAGDSFADIYGLKRFFALSLAKVGVARPHQRLILSPQTIGPFERPGMRHLARWLMARCRAVVVREDLSLRLVREMKLGTEVIEATDVAFRLPYRPASRSKRCHQHRH